MTKVAVLCSLEARCLNEKKLTFLLVQVRVLCNRRNVYLSLSDENDPLTREQPNMGDAMSEKHIVNHLFPIMISCENLALWLVSELELAPS